MNGDKFFLDTNAIIILLQKGYEIPKKKYFFSIITEIELLSFPKLEIEEERLIKQALKNFKKININEKIKEYTVKIRKENLIKIPDALIIASSIYKNAILVTNDKQLHKYTKCITIEELKDMD